MSQERKPEREPVRQSLSNQGPQYVSKEFLDDNYHYRWVDYTPKKMWAAIEKERLGYDPVPASEVSNYMKSKVIKTQTNIDEGFVTCDLRDGGQAVLMRISKKEYLERKIRERAASKKAYEDTYAEELKGLSIDGTKQTFSFTR